MFNPEQAMVASGPVAGEFVVLPASADVVFQIALEELMPAIFYPVPVLESENNKWAN